MKNQPEVIGSRYAIATVIIVIILIHLFLFKISFYPYGQLKDAHYWFIKGFKNLPITILTGSISLLLSAYWLGKRAGRKIINDNKASGWQGGITFLGIFVIVGSLSCLLILAEIGWQTAGWRNTMEYMDMYLPWLSVVLSAGFLPSIVIGIIYGWLVEKKGKKTQT